jgi:RNA processing factor Prp31
MKVKTSISIEENLLEIIKKAAASERRTVSNYIESFIERIAPEVEKELACRSDSQTA